MHVLSQVFLIVVILFIYTYADPLVVQTTYGKIRGSTMSSRLGKTIYSFQGIRYAKPPLGPLRFQAPQNLEPWDGVMDATMNSPACPQVEGLSNDEDCLFLNVYTTNMSNSSKPVFVFIHPGLWYLFTGRSEIFGPQYMLDRDVVLVTSNYRLGALGFLSTGDEALPGNQGLKDQVAVLRWVRDNIAPFGGDPDQVTIGGYDVGGYSVLLHLVSPMSKGLFKQAIVMSVMARVDFMLMTNAKEIFNQHAEFLNCSTNVSSQEVVECLKNKSAEEIINSSKVFTEPPFPLPLAWIGPVVEKERQDGNERFLVEEPIQSFSSGRFDKDIPIIIGHNLNEIDFITHYLLLSKRVIKLFNENSSYAYPDLLMYKENSKKELITSRLKKFYLNDQPITKESETALGHMYSDGTVNFPAYRAAKLIADKSNAPVYFYHFTYQGRYSWGIEETGVNHYDDLMYLFYVYVKVGLFKETDPETQMVEKYTNLFSNFFNFGNPNGGDSSEIIWSPLTKENAQYLEIGNNSLEMIKGWPNFERMQIWDELFPISQENQNQKHTY